MHIVLSGYFGFDNVGDEAILFSIIRALRKIDPAVELTVLSNNPSETAATYGVGAVNRWNIGEIRSCLRSADGLISGGGSLMQDATSAKTIPYYAGVIKLAQMARVPVFVYAQGMGPINGGLGKWLVKSVFNKCAGITVRDEASFELLREIGVRLPVTVVPDPVVGLGGNVFTSEWLENWLQSLHEVESGAVGHNVGEPDDGLDSSVGAAHDSDIENGAHEDSFTESKPMSFTSPSYVTVSVRDWPTEVDYKKKIAVALDAIAATGYHIVFIPMHGEHDVKASADVAGMMNAESIIAPGDLSIEEKIAVIGGSQLLIGQRLHSLIFASIEYIPFIALSYDPKIDAFADIVQQPVIGHVEKDDWSGDDLSATAFEILENYKEKVDALRLVVEPLQSSAENTAKMAIDAFSAKK